MTRDGIEGSIAGAAVTSPVWLPWLREISQIAALLLPILGVLWFVVRIAKAVKDWRKPPPPSS